MKIESTFTVQRVGPGMSPEGTHTPHFLGISVRSIPPEVVFCAGPQTVGEDLRLGKEHAQAAMRYSRNVPLPFRGLITISEAAAQGIDFNALAALQKFTASRRVHWEYYRSERRIRVTPDQGMQTVTCLYENQEVRFRSVRPRDIVLAGVRAVILRSLG